MEEFIKSTKQKIVQLEKEISKSNASDVQKSNMQHTLSKINIFSGDVFDDALKYKNKSKDVYSITKEQILKYKAEHPSCGATHDTLRDLFPEAFETVFDPKKYYKVITGGDGALGTNNAIGKVIQRPETYPKNYGGEMWDSKKHTGIYFQLVSERVWGLCAGYKLIEATESEVFEALKNEAVKRGYRSGIYIKGLGDGKIIFLDGSEGFNQKRGKKILSLNCNIFDSGKWAEIIPTITKEEAEEILKKKIV